MSDGPPSEEGVRRALAVEADAPGWAFALPDAAAESTTGGTVSSSGPVSTIPAGPTCYKCFGSGFKLTPEEKARRATKRIRLDEEEEDAEKRPRIERTPVTCPACKGVGFFPPKRIKPPVDPAKRARRVPAGWTPPGPSPKGGVEPREDEELCQLVGAYKIFQKKAGHRWSNDDLITAWVAITRVKALNPNPVGLKLLDLGCGIGSVLQMTAWAFPDATCLGVEAQRASAEMARRSIEYNGCSERARVMEGDMREVVHHGDELRDLVTGTPPYFPIVTLEDGRAVGVSGGLPTHAQSAPARFEFRGGMEVYFEAGAKVVVPETGRVVVCEGLLDKRAPLRRAQLAAFANGLELLETVLVHGRDDKPPLFAVHVSKKPLVAPEAMREDTPASTIIIRHRGGKRALQYLELVRDMGIPPYEDEEGPAERKSGGEKPAV